MDPTWLCQEPIIAHHKIATILDVGTAKCTKSDVPFGGDDGKYVEYLHKQTRLFREIFPKYPRLIII